jgi:hypothetical protein
MSRKTDRKSKGLPAIQTRKQELEAQAAQLKAKLNQTREFLEKAPALKEEAQRKQQRAIFDRFNRPARVEGPVDFQLRYDASRNAAPPKRLRRERSKTPWVTLLLLAVFAVVVYFSWKALWQG